MSADLASSAASGSLVDPVRALQHTLYRSAKADPGRRFHALRDKVYRRDVLWRAWVAVRRNNGAPGVDGTTLAEVEEYGVDRFLDELAEDLRADRWRPLPARRVLIPKPGTSEQRPLSIPSVRDRVVAAAVKIVLEPIFEAGFLSCSFGFRPKRSTHDALQVLIDESWQGKRWVVETDIANCFSAIPHEKLMQAIEERVSDQGVLKLLRAMLRAGVMQDDGSVRREVSGTPQGGPLSPLLCNVYLHRLDRVWDTSEHGVLVRYCDDLVVMCRSREQAEAALERLTVLLGDLGLEPKASKTRIVHWSKAVREWISWASTIGWCAGGLPGRRIWSSSVVGLRVRRSNMHGIGFGRSPPDPVCWCRSSGSWRNSTCSCAAGRGISASATPH